MKVAGQRSLTVVFLCASALLAVGNDFKSEILPMGGSKLLSVPDNHFLVIRNFTQEGGTTRGIVTVTDNNAQIANVLAATIIDPATATPVEVVNSIVIAGPSAVTVTCGTGATHCFVSYRRDSE